MSARKPDPAPLTPEGTRSPASVAHSPGSGHRIGDTQPHWTDNPDHPLHITAMAQRCPICHAQPGKPCQTITSRPLNRRIHIGRTEIR